MWRRVCVDVDPDGRPLGWSVSWRDDDGYILEMATSAPGPFDRVRDAFEEALQQTMRQQELDL